MCLVPKVSERQWRAIVNHSVHVDVCADPAGGCQTGCGSMLWSKCPWVNVLPRNGPRLPKLSPKVMTPPPQSVTFHCCNQTLTKSNLQKKGFILVSSSRGGIHNVRGGTWQQPAGAESRQEVEKVKPFKAHPSVVLPSARLRLLMAPYLPKQQPAAEDHVVKHLHLCGTFLIQTITLVRHTIAPHSQLHGQSLVDSPEFGLFLNPLVKNPARPPHLPTSAQISNATGCCNYHAWGISLFKRRLNKAPKQREFQALS